MVKKETITPKRIITENDLKKGEKEIRRAYFKSWYESCKDIYNKERRKKRRVKKKTGK